jgi:hypothetical protein
MAGDSSKGGVTEVVKRSENGELIHIVYTLLTLEWTF